MRIVNVILAVTIVVLVVMIFDMAAAQTSTGSGAGNQSASAPRGPTALADATSRGAGGQSPSTQTAGSRITGSRTTSSTVTGQAPGGGTPTENSRGDGTVDERGAAALAAITYPWQERLPGWTIAFHPAEEGAYGYTLTREHHIDIYVRPDQSHELLVHVIAHELGHAVDVSLNDSEDRRNWQDARNIGDAPWWPDNRAADFATGAGDFAESFAAWQVGPASFRSNLGDPPTPAQLDLLAELAEG